MQSRDLPWYITRALGLLSRDVPQAYSSIQESCDGLRLAVQSDRSQGTVWITIPRIEVFGPSPDCDVTAQFQETVITDLIDARLTIGETLDQDLLVLIGSTENLDRLVAGLQLFLRGAIRSRAMQELLEDFRGHLAL